MEWYLKVLRQFADFNGRARRQEYWMFVLFNFVFSFVVGFVDGIIGTGGILGGLYMLVVFIPGIAVSVRRLHDVGKSGWMMLVALIPLVGFIWLIVLMATEGEYKENQYGPNPKKMAGPGYDRTAESTILDDDFE